MSVPAQAHRNRNRRRRGRGFVLIIVLLIALAAAAIALALTASGGAAKVRAVRSEHGDLSSGIAHAGMQRAKAYANTASSGTEDYDDLLDPGLNANCAALPGGAPSCPTCNLPDFTDGTPVTYLGKVYEKVAFNGGAYLVRIEDDNDDQHADPATATAWAPNTNNNVGGVNCIEGPTVLLGRDNPFRDRNRAVMITVIGISPGEDPNSAQHRTVLRLLHSNNSAGAVAGIVVKGNIDVQGAAELLACSDVGRLEVDGNLIGPGGGGEACACGDSVADTLGGWDHCTNVAGACPVAVGCAPGALGTPGPAPPPVLAIDSALGKNEYFDWTKPCTFYIENPGAATQLWVWDPLANRGPAGTPCSNIAVDNAVGWPVPPDLSQSDTASYRGCWTPLILAIDAACPTNLWGENGAACGWAPDNDVNTISDATLNPVLSGLGLPTLPGAATIRKPAFGAECVVDYPGPTPPKSCTTCNGTNTVFSENPGPKPYWFIADSAATIRAVPAGVYIFGTGALDIGNTDMTGAFPNSTVLNLDEMPLATIAALGDISGSGITFLGVGVDKPSARFPSLITNGSISWTGGSNKLFAGTMWARGNMDWNGSSQMFLFGEVHLEGNWNLGGSGQYHWRYGEAFGAVAAGGVGIPALVQSFE